MDATLRDTIKQLLGDIEAMRCDCPSRDVRESGGEDDQTHWFGGFGQGHFDYEDVETFYIQWPNLGILAEKLQALMIDRVMIGRPLDQ
jgi:hypothetical protein